MKIFAIAATALLATVAYASPAPVEARDPTVHVTFIGAAGVTFIQSILPDNTLRAITNTLSVSKISVPAGYICIFYGTDRSVTTVVGADTEDVAPPQTQASGQCRYTSAT